MLENLKTLVHYRCLSRIILSWGMVKAHCKHNLSKSNLSLLHYLRWWAYILIILIFAFATQYHRFPIDLSVSSTITHPMIRRIVFTSLGSWDCTKQKFDRNCLLENYFFITKWVAHAHQRFFSELGWTREFYEVIDEYTYNIDCISLERLNISMDISESLLTL